MSPRPPELFLQVGVLCKQTLELGIRSLNASLHRCARALAQRRHLIDRTALHAPKDQRDPVGRGDLCEQPIPPLYKIASDQGRLGQHHFFGRRRMQFNDPADPSATQVVSHHVDRHAGDPRTLPVRIAYRARARDDPNEHILNDVVVLNVRTQQLVHEPVDVAPVPHEERVARRGC